MRDLKEIEFAFLGCIFDKPGTRIPEALKVRANENWFSDQSCRLVWVSIESLRKKTAVEKIKPLVIIEEAIRISNRKKSPFFGQKITPTFIDEAKRFRDAAEEGESPTIEAYAPVLQEAAKGRLLNEAMNQAKEDGRTNTERLLALEKQIQKIQKDESPESDISISGLLDNMVATYDKGYEEFAVKHNYNYIPGIPFPWDCVSHLTKGLTPGLHIIAARPSVGKTSFVMQCINFWCDLGYKVAFDCLDMSVTELIKRPVANMAWVSPTRMEFGWASPEEQYRVREAVEKVRNYYTDGLMTWTLEPDVDKLKSWAEIRHRAGKLDILVIDFAQRFRLKGTTSEYEIATYASGVLKQLANECLIPVILLSQLSRDNVKDPNGKRPPELSDLRGSGALEQDATSVVLLHKVKEVIDVWRNEPPLYFVDEANDDRLRDERATSISAVIWNLAKNQNGPTGEIPFVVFQNCFRWYIGDRGGSGSTQFQKVEADWRFMEEPFATIEKKGAATYPKFWPQKCAEMCGKLGVEIPPQIKEQLNEWDLNRYNSLISERGKKMEEIKVSAATPIVAKDVPPPSVSYIATEFTEPSPIQVSNETVQHNDVVATNMEDLDNKLTETVKIEETREPSFEDEFEDENF